MKDSKLDERKAKFHTCNKLNKNLASLDIVEARESHRMTLRKKKIDEIITKKRDEVSIKNKQIFEIDPDQLMISNETREKIYEDMDEFLSDISNILLNEKSDINNIKFAIYLIRNQFSSIRNSNKKIILKYNIIKALLSVLEKFSKDSAITVYIYSINLFSMKSYGL